MNYKYNELSYAELICKNGFQTKHTPTELRLLALYCRDILNLKAKERTEYLYDFCNRHISGFKKENFFKSINKALKSASKKQNKFIEIKEVCAYANEIKYINSLDVKYEYKKIMFSFLIQTKLNKIIYEQKNKKDYNGFYFKGGKKKYNNIKKISNVSNKLSINDEVINELDKIGLIKIIHGGLILLDYLKNCIEEGDVVLHIQDYDNIGLYFDYYNDGNNINICESEACNNIFKSQSNRHTYCRECWKEIRKEQNKNKSLKYYHNQKLYHLEKS